MRQYLINDRPLILLPTLAALVGVERAVILQQIHFALNQPKSGRVRDGHKWIWNTYEEWKQDHFPFWTPRYIADQFRRLEKDGYLISCQPDKKAWQRHKYYRVNYDAVNSSNSTLTIDETCNYDDTKNVPSDTQKTYLLDDTKNVPSLTETTTETTTEQRENAHATDELFLAAKSAYDVVAPYLTNYQPGPEQLKMLAAITDIPLWTDVVTLWEGRRIIKTMKGVYDARLQQPTNGESNGKPRYISAGERNRHNLANAAKLSAAISDELSRLGGQDATEVLSSQQSFPHQY